MIWLRLAVDKNKELKPESKNLMWRLIILAYFTVFVQVYFSVALQNYALDNPDPCEDICGTAAEEQCS